MFNDKKMSVLCQIINIFRNPKDENSGFKQPLLPISVSGKKQDLLQNYRIEKSVDVQFNAAIALEQPFFYKI